MKTNYVLSSIFLLGLAAWNTTDAEDKTFELSQFI